MAFLRGKVAAFAPPAAPRAVMVTMAGDDEARRLQSESNVELPASPVLIIGTGPAGLFAACELLRYGVRPRIVERRLAPHHEARGTALQPATLEIIDRGGLIEPFLRAGVHVRANSAAWTGLARNRNHEILRYRKQV